MKTAALRKFAASPKKDAPALSKCGINACLLLAGIFIFSLSHPGIISSRGFSFLGFIALVPVFLIARNASWKSVWLWGFLYGLLSYALYCFWLVKYELIAYIVACAVYGILLALVFLALHFVFTFFKKYEYLMAVLVWCIYEYVKTLGFLGFSYGIMGYSQWRNTLLMQSASFGGVWIVSFVCVSCSALIAELIESLRTREVAKLKIPVISFSVLVVFVVIFGVVQLTKKNQSEKVKIVCVQNNVDPWKTGVDSYRKDIHSLKTLTDIALEKHPDVQFVVWPESAVVTPILYAYSGKSDSSRLEFITDLLSYIESKSCAFVIGNEQSEESHTKFTDDYNAVLVFDNQKNPIIPPQPDIYRKMHLVPFTEYFPYGKIFPHLYKQLLNGDTHLWTPGKEAVVFTNRGVSFSTPICFEDTFGSVCRKFTQRDKNKNHAQFFINVSNDAWSHSKSCQYQHLSMAVFRCVENGIPAARSTASGVTCFIDRRGKVQQEQKQFKETVAYEELEVPKMEASETLYTKTGDWFPFAELLIVLLMAIRETTCRVVERKRRNEVK